MSNAAKQSWQKCKFVDFKVVCGYLSKQLLEDRADFVLDEFDRVSRVGRGKFKFVVVNSKEANVSALGKLLHIKLETKTFLTPTARSLEWLFECMFAESLRVFSVALLKDKW